MKYQMKAGVLYREGEEIPLARIKWDLRGPEKQILAPDGTVVMRADIRLLTPPVERTGDVRRREYVLRSREERVCMSARPDYAREDDPAVSGWPICRAPRVDHAAVVMEERPYVLTMRNKRDYLLRGADGDIVAEITHRGVIGGWDLEAEDRLSPFLLCGLFIFCRYIEKENEFLVV